MKNIITKFILFYFIFLWKIFSAEALYIEVIWIHINFWGWGWWNSAPWVVCEWLPWCSSSIWWKSFFSFLWNFISYWIKYTAVIAVIALMIAWIMYLISGWEDEKIKKAKTYIIWSLVWVIISTSAWAIINVINSFKIN